MTESRPHAGMVMRTRNGLRGATSGTVPDLEYRVSSLSKIRVTGSEIRPLQASIKVAGRQFRTTPRFWTSFMAKFGFSDSMFRYFGHQEVFDRICEKKPDAELRFCVDPVSETALAVSNPAKAAVVPSSFMEIARKYRGSDVQYAEGVVLSTFTPPSGERQTKIGPDLFANRFVLETPLDGYGKPSIYLSLLREVCMNGAVAYAPAFRQDITLGTDPEHAIGRSLDSFDSDDGYSAVRSRFQAAQSSPASLWECRKLFKTIQRLNANAPAVKAYEKVVGDVYGQYGVANFDAFVEKKLRLMSAQCKVYDLLNLASEISTHHAKDRTESQALQAWLGTTIAEEFDLEGTSEKVGDFEETFIPDTRKRPRRRAQAS